jgi:hypothetical protein
VYLEIPESDPDTPTKITLTLQEWLHLAGAMRSDLSGPLLESLTGKR